MFMSLKYVYDNGFSLKNNIILRAVKMLWCFDMEMTL